MRESKLDFIFKITIKKGYDFNPTTDKRYISAIDDVTPSFSVVGMAFKRQHFIGPEQKTSSNSQAVVHFPLQSKELLKEKDEERDPSN